MEEANLKESNRHGNPSKSSRHATLSSSTFRLSGPSSLLVRTQGAVCLFMCVCGCVCVCLSLSLSLSLCVCVYYLSVSTRACRHRSYTIGACRRNWEWRKGKNNESGIKEKNKLQVWKLQIVVQITPQQKKASHGTVKNKKPRPKKKKKTDLKKNTADAAVDW